MTIPSLFFSWLIASAMGLAFHLLRGGSFPRLVLFLVTAWLAFFAGHLVGNWLNWHLWRYGPLNLFPAVLATVIGLLAASILAGSEGPVRKKRN
jgi:uncharacterized membrane protein YccC